MQPTQNEVREAHPIQVYGAHWDGCWRNHVPCAIAILCDDLDAKDREIAELRAAIRSAIQFMRSTHWPGTVEAEEALKVLCDACGVEVEDPEVARALRDAKARWPE